MAKGEGGGWRPSGGGGPVRRGPKADWIPTAQKPKSRARQFKIAALLLLFLAIVGGGVYLYYRLQPPNPPVLLVITTDPAADAADLQAPIDPYGWMSGQELEKWSNRYDAIADDAEKKHAPRAVNGSGQFKNNDTIKSEADLADWALREARHSGSLSKASETAILYFGLHTGADAEGPYLHVNKGRRFHVEKLLAALSAKLGDTRVLVMFDPARQIPDPVRGQLHDGFVDAMKAKEMSDLLAGLANLTVILGCDSGERGWESEELKRTAFAHAIVEGLGGKAQPGRDRYVTALDLFKSVKESTSNWSRQNRPTTQTPVLLPEGSEGERRAFETTLMLHHATTDDPAKPADPTPSLIKRWTVVGALASQSPGPEVYSPRRWRRYRELLLRYEHTARAGEEKSMEALNEELNKEERAIRAAQAATFIADSRTASVPMWQAAGQAPAIGPTYDSELRQLGSAFLNTGTDEALRTFAAEFAKLSDHRVAYSNDILRLLLKTAAGEPTVSQPALARRARLVRTMWEVQAVRPPDVQLFLMLDQFSRLHENETWPSETDVNGKTLWQRAIHVRRLAEEAALGPVSDSHPYSEAVWRVVRTVVESGDASRRRAEDLLFTLDKDRKPAFADLEAAEKQYLRAIRRAEELRVALALRDETLADLPHLGRWAVFEGEEKFTPKPRDLWKSVHKLAKLLDELPAESAEAGTPAIQAKYTELKTAADETRDGFEKLKAEYARAVEAESKGLVKLQSTWLTREKLLLVPPLRLKLDALDIRGKIVSANRAATAYFLDPNNKTVSRADDERERTRTKKDRAIALGYLGLNELGKDLIDRQKAGDDKLSSWDAINEEITRINEKTWKEAAEAGVRLQSQFAKLGDAADPAAADSKAAEAERASRSAIASEFREGREPAETNRDFRWQRLFVGQAQRAVIDHWYDDDASRPKYFNFVAEAFLKNADALTPPDRTRATDKAPGHDPRTLLGFNETEYAEFLALKAADPLRVAAVASGSPWTTEPQKTVTFRVTAGPIPPESQAVVWAAFDPKESKKRQIRFATGTADRKPLLLKTGISDLTLVLLPPDAAQSVTESVTVRRGAFFRGQVAREETPVDLRRLPDLIATHARPQADPHARPQADRPRVAFFGRNDIDVGVVTIVIDYSPSMTDVAENNKSGNPRIKRTWDELEKILQGLPNGTKLNVRGFGVAPDAGQAIKPRAFESATTKGGVDPDDPAKEKFPGTYDRRVISSRTTRWDGNPQDLKDVMTVLQGAPLQTTDAGPTKRDGVQSPVVRTMLHALEEDFEDAHPQQTKVLIVLTDGADNSCWDYAMGEKPKRNFRKPLGELQKELKSGKGAGVTVRMLLINDEDTSAADSGVTEEFAKEVRPVLKRVDPEGSVSVGKVDKLAEELRDLLRPRVRLARDGKLFADLPIRFDAPRWERPQWSPALPELEYESWVGRDQPQQLEFTPADRMLVRLTRPDASKPVQYERALWGRYGAFGQELDAAKRVVEQPDKPWLLSVPMYRSSIAGYLGENLQESGRHCLDLTAAVEDLATIKSQPLKQPAPAFMWWELSSDVPLTTKEAPVYLWREYKNPAPSWRFRRPGWTDASDEQRLPKGMLRGWALQRDRQLPARDFTTIEELAEAAAAGKASDGTAWRNTWETPDWTLSLGWELHTFATNPDVQEPEKPRYCLAVRIHSKNKERLPQIGGKPAPFFAQVNSAQIEEHRYFRALGAYTGYFVVGTSTSPDSALGRKVSVFSAADLVEPKLGVPLEFSLPNASAQGGDAIWQKWTATLEPELPPSTKSP